MSKHKGVIKICVQFGNRIDTIPYEYELLGHDSKVSETLVSNFDWLNLPYEEKVLLTLSDRKDILLLKNFPKREINDHAIQLNLLLNSFESTNVTLKADFFGALICLSTLNIDQLAPNCRLTLHLHNFPPQLIPEELAEIPESLKCHIIFHSESEINLEKFGSLFEKSPLDIHGPTIIKRDHPIKFRNSA